MTHTRTYQTPAIIIKKTKLGEADRILTMYSPTLGKFQGIAKAVRKPKSKLSGHLEMLTYAQVTLVHGKTIDTIIGGQTINSFLSLRNDLDLISCALYMAEILFQFVPEETVDQGLFTLLLSSLECLPFAKDRNQLLRYFEMHLLQGVGYRPELSNCVFCRRELAPITNAFAPSAGGVLCPSCIKLGKHYAYAVSWDCLGVMLFLQEGDLESVLATPIETTVINEIERLIRSYVRHLLEKEIKSIAWLNSLKQNDCCH
ncbi:MAG: DNA repair protein RecO [Dehalococcoidia bacterium]|nr:DNA repair protein RecO [Dehalococcoidia bacterium]